MYQFIIAELVATEVTNLDFIISFYKRGKGLQNILKNRTAYIEEEKQLEKYLKAYEAIYNIVGDNAQVFLAALEVATPEAIRAKSDILQLSKNLVHILACQPFLRLCEFRHQAILDVEKITALLKSLTGKLTNEGITQYRFFDFESELAAIFQRFFKYELFAKEIKKQMIEELSGYYTPQTFSQNFKKSEQVLLLLNSSSGLDQLKQLGMSSHRAYELQLLYNITDYVEIIGKIFSAHYNLTVKFAQSTDLRVQKPDNRDPLYIANRMCSETHSELANIEKNISAEIDKALKEKQALAEKLNKVNEKKDAEEEARIIRISEQLDERINSLLEKRKLHSQALTRIFEIVGALVHKKVDEIKDFESQMKILEPAAKLMLQQTYLLLGEDKEADFERRGIRPSETNVNSNVSRQNSNDNSNKIPASGARPRALTTGRENNTGGIVKQTNINPVSPSPAVVAENQRNRAMTMFPTSKPTPRPAPAVSQSNPVKINDVPSSPPKKKDPRFMGVRVMPDRTTSGELKTVKTQLNPIPPSGFNGKN